MIRDSRRKAKRVRRALERKAAIEARMTAARARVSPEPTTRTSMGTSTPTSTMCHQPFESTINEYRQTPESWRDVWADVRDGTP